MQKLRIFVRSSIRQEKAVRKPIAEFKANSKLTGLHSECIQLYVLRSITARISLALIAFSAYSKGGDWPNWRGPSHDGFSTETAWSLEKAEVIWKKQVGVGFSSISVVDNLVYTQGHDGRKKGGKETVYCLSARTGERWFGRMSTLLQLWTTCMKVALVRPPQYIPADFTRLARMVA